MKQELEVAIIILGAGSSSRLGSSKQLLILDGESLLSKSIKASLASNATKVIVVLGANHALHYKEIKDFPIDITVNEHWSKGMGNSLKKGLIHLLQSNNTYQGAVILVCDQPMLTANHINILIDDYNKTKKPIIASWYGESPGVPVFFHKQYFEKLLMLDDMHGAKKIIEKNMQDVLSVDFPEGEVDIDTREDYEKLLNSRIK